MEFGLVCNGLRIGHLWTLWSRSSCHRFLLAFWGATLVRTEFSLPRGHTAVMQVVQHLNVSVPRLCQLLRCLYFYAAHFHFTFSATNTPGTQNVAADALSCGNMSLFHSCSPQVPQHTVPTSVSNLFMVQLPDWSSAAWIAQFRTVLLAAGLAPFTLKV